MAKQIGLFDFRNIRAPVLAEKKLQPESLTLKIDFSHFWVPLSFNAFLNYSAAHPVTEKVTLCIILALLGGRKVSSTNNTMWCYKPCQNFSCRRRSLFCIDQLYVIYFLHQFKLHWIPIFFFFQTLYCIIC